MKKMYKIILPLLLFLVVFNVKAASASIYISSTSSVYNGNDISVSIVINNVNVPGGIVGVGGNINYDTSYFDLVSASPATSPYAFKSTNSTGYARFAGQDFTNEAGIKSTTTIVTYVFRAKKLGNTTFRLTDVELSAPDGSIVSSSVSNKPVSIVEPPSSNNNLSSLSVNVGGLSPAFSQGNTNYSVTVESDVASIDISATPADGGARVEGTGTKGLNYGNNTLGVKVTAPSGATKTYTITVNRKDNRSTNNNLANLSISGASLDQSFDPNNTNYTAKVPYETETANINATPQDGKARVSISGNSGLVSEETSNVSVTVYAENGAAKTYTIAVTRGKDPNKILATDNHLRKLEASIGILSPVFDPEKENYVIYLPYEVDSISFNAIVSDSRYGVLNIDAPDKLVPGIANVFKFSVTAEDESVKTYTVVVKRAINPETETSSDTYLESIKLNNGELLYTNGKVVKDFNREIKKYFYKKNKGFTYEAIPEDPNAAVTTVIDGSSIQFIVEAPNGEFSIYTLDLYGSYNNIYKNILFFILGLICGITGSVLVKKIKDKKSSKPKEEVKKDKKKKDDE